MVDVDPLVLIAAGTAVLGLATVAICTRGPAAKKSETTSKRRAASEQVAAAPVSAPADVAVVKKGKKKVRSSKKKKNASSDNLTAEESQSEPEPEVKKPEAKKPENKKPVAAPVVQEAPVEIFDDEDDIDLPVFSNKAGLAEAQKQKKAKETPEQKAARVERQKIKEAKKAAAEEKAAAAARKIAAAEAESDFNNFASSPTTQQTFDGWAVVEKSKSKAKKDAEGDSPASPVNSTPVPEVVAPVVVETPAPVVPVIETVTVPMTVDSKKLGLLIGPKGVTKIGIQQATGATIEMPKVEKDAPAAPVTVNVSGTEASVNRAIHALNELVVKGYSVLLAGDDFQEGYVAIHPRFLPDVIGKQGVVIRALQQHTGVKITTPTNTTKSDGSAASKIKINLAGPREKVTEARNLIKEITKYYHTPVTHPGVVHTELDIPANYYNYIIGAKGSEIKHIQANFKVNVYIPNAESNNTNVLIVGEPSNVVSAEKHIQKLIEKVNAQAEARAAQEAQAEAFREANKAARAAAAAAAGTAAPTIGYSVGGGGKPSTAKVDKDDEPVEEWMQEFAPRSSGMDFSALLPATSKFVGEAPAAVTAAPEKEQETVAEVAASTAATEGKTVWGASPAAVAF